MVSGTCVDCPREDGAPVPAKCKHAERYDHRAPVSLRFTIPGPPVPKARARVVTSPGKPARGITPVRTKAYERHVGMMALAARSQWERQLTFGGGRSSWPTARLYAVTVSVFRKSGARGDIDNYCKASLDGCNGILWDDDSHVHDLHAVIVDLAIGAERVEVSVRVIE